jgi:hypothetical protein
MAHQANIIPWEALSSNLKFAVHSQDHNGQTDLFTQNKPGQGEQIMDFAKVFAHMVGSASDSERAKYPAIYEAAAPEEEVIHSKVASKIEPTVRRYRSTNPRLSGRRLCRPECGRTSYCTCQLSPEERSMSFWLSEIPCHCTMFNCCCDSLGHTDAVELTKTLLIHGEMDTLLRISAHPHVNLALLWDYPWICSDEFGWDELVRCALLSYICLNVFFLKSETHNTTSRAEYLENEKLRPTIGNGELDYRKARSFETMVSRCTGMSHFDVHTYPHRAFFGVEPKIPSARKSHGEYSDHLWKLSPYILYNPTEEYKPLRSDIPIVFNYIRQKGLPPELILQVLELAAYVPRRKLIVAEDPLHAENAQELQIYLADCWNLLVRCDILAKAQHKRINWIYEVTHCIRECWSIEDPKATRKLRWSERPHTDPEWLSVTGWYEFS